MPIQFYHLEISSPCRAVDMVIHHFDIPVHYINVDLFSGDHLKPEFIKLNPAHTIPVIDDEGFILYESRAICAYLMNKYGKDDSLYPKDVLMRGKVDEQLYFSDDLFYLFKIITLQVLNENLKILTNKQNADILDRFKAMEQILSKQDYFAGNQLTIADLSNISFVPALQVYLPINEENKFPCIANWISRCEKNITRYKDINAKGLEELKNLILKHFRKN
uniref:Uncharacterized protein n=2 Tax=Clastoptera arizonana TaxID=38151 RepID=A0A1B6DWY0_9HEMI